MEHIQKSWEQNKKTILLSLIAALLLGMAAHAFLFFNPSFSHDALWVNQYHDDEWKLSIGRFMQPFWRILRGSIVATWLIGMLAMLANGVSSFLLCKIFGLRSRAALVGVNGILVCNLCVTFTFFSFSHEADFFAIACLLAVLGLSLVDRNWMGWLLCAVCVAMSMGFYQAYVGVAVGIAVLVALLDLLKMASGKGIVKKQMRYFGAIALGGVLYLAGSKITQLLSGVPAGNTYNSLSNMANVGLDDLLKGILGAYEQFAAIVFVNPPLYGESPFRGYLKALFFIASVVAFFAVALYFLFRCFVKNKLSASRMLCCVALLGIYPLAANCVIVGSGLSQVHMALASCLIFIPAFWLMEQGRLPENFSAHMGRVLGGVACVSLCLILVCNIVFANGLYTVKYLQERQTLSTMTRIVDRMEQTDGFVPTQTPVIFIGLLEDNQTLTGNDFMLNEYYKLGVPQYSITYVMTIYMFLQYYLHYPVIPADAAESAAVQDSAAVKGMGVFPQKDSVQMVDGMMVVKLA